LQYATTFFYDIIKSMGKQIKNGFDVNNDIECTSCGAVFNIHMPKCPYCGWVNELGNEEEYLKHLEEIRRSLDEVASIPERAYKDEAKTGIKKAIKVFIILVIVFALIIAGVVVGTAAFSVYMKNQELKQAEWEKENYPILDRMYEDGDYDGLVEFWDDLISLDGSMKYTIWSWDHYQFLTGYRCYYSIKGYWDNIKSGDAKKGDYNYHYGFSNAMQVLTDTWQIKYETVKSIDKREYEQIKEYQEYAREFLHDVFDLSDSEIDELCTKVLQDPPGVGYDYNKIDEVFKSLQ